MEYVSFECYSWTRTAATWRWECCFFFSSRRRHTRCSRDWSSDVCSSDLAQVRVEPEHFVPHLPVKPAHHADDDDQHGHTQHHAENRNQSNDRDKCPFGAQVTKREKQFKRQLGHRAEASR